MDSKTIAATKQFVDRYAHQAAQSFESKRNQTLSLFMNKKVPDEGWSEADIECLMNQISMMDSNNFSGNCGVGEREARFASDIVARRHFRMGHGIGRSGDITEVQPKAAGSTLIAKLANEFVLDILKSNGAPGTKKCLIVPVATGMGLVLCMRTLHSMRPEAKYVIWSRIDQKSCFKCILTAGLKPCIINCKIDDKKLVTDVDAIHRAINNLGSANIVCVLTTTSCFAPRAPDSLEEVGSLCAQYDIPHLVNNAYGIQCPSFLTLIEKAFKKRLDVYVSSTDKNFMVPVGGCIIASSNSAMINDIGKMYPGRASAAPSVDVFITLLNIGHKGYHKLLQDREILFLYLRSELEKIADAYQERTISIPKNPISLGLTLNNFGKSQKQHLTEIGSMLFSKFVSGARVVALGDTKEIAGYKFQNWGSHTDSYESSYLTAASSIGVTKNDIDIFIGKLKIVLEKMRKNILFLVD